MQDAAEGLDPARVPPPERRWRPVRGRGRACRSRYVAGDDFQIFENELDARGRFVRRRTRAENSGWTTIEAAGGEADVDAAQRVVRVRRVEGWTATYTYDAEGRVVRIEGPLEVATCTYRDDGWPAQATQLGSVRTYVYDDEGHLLGFVTVLDVGRHETTIEREGDGFVAIRAARGGWPEVRHTYDGECADVFFAPCSRTFAPPLDE